MQLTWTTVQKTVDELLPAEYNPRQMREDQAEQLEKSLKKFGLVEIPAINTDGTILAGHQRITVLKRLGKGQELIDVRVPSRPLTNKEAQEYNLRSNKNVGEWDYGKLFAMDENLLKEVGFDDDFMDNLLGNKAEASEDDFEQPDTETIKTDIKLGDIIEIGEHRLMCGDSTSLEQAKRLLDSKLADVCFTDPPYNTGMGKKNAGSTRLNHMFEDSYTDEEWKGFMEGFCNTISSCLKDDSVAYICLDWRRNYELVPNIKKHFHLSNTIVWDKVVHGLGSDYKYTYELINVCKKGKPKLDTHQGTEAEYSDVWHIQRKMGKDEEHATKKPIELVARALRHSTKTGDIVLDIFLGSGSTMVAAHQLGRKCYGMELDPKYCQVIVNRMRALDDTLTVKRNGIVI